MRPGTLYRHPNLTDLDMYVVSRVHDTNTYRVVWVLRRSGKIIEDIDEVTIADPRYWKEVDYGESAETTKTQ